ncbi:hypothetical protein E2P81_ATG08485 [Venturia nashicola]|uniref:F-box domain-containing protein n=1 Tax=Venturia nashicola TaxID=86259 RepID=A0A4Z1NGE8_9PEZI|nr:hypothetical protein E6O75_ATG08679 [Venturia nashicola]TLD20821.1 hypothetical protein E2P81_ATG08485 [Venturia nashicola]
MEVGEKMAAFNGDSSQPQEVIPDMTADTAEKKSESNNMEMAKNNASDNPKTTNKKQILLTVPTEVLENIASFTGPKDLLNLRLANREVAERTFDAFANVFLETFNWDFERPERNLEWVGLLKLNSRFALGVKHLNVGIPPQWSRNNQFTNGMRMLQNLRSLKLAHGIWLAPWTPSVIFPRLEEFFVAFTKIDYRLAIYFIQAHTASLKSVVFRFAALSASDTGGKAAWLQVLDSCKALRPEAILKISAPMLPGSNTLVYFSPPLREFNPNIHPLDFFVEGKFCNYGITYSTRPGNLQMSLDFMIRHYKELGTEEEQREYGGGSKLIASDTDDDSEEEEDEDDSEEEEDDSEDEDEN